MPNPVTGEQSIAEIIADVDARQQAQRTRRPYSGNPDAADPELDRRLVALSAAGHSWPPGLSQRALRRWADLAERRQDAERLGEEQDREDEAWQSAQDAAHAEADARQRAQAEARAQAEEIVAPMYTFGGRR